MGRRVVSASNNRRIEKESEVPGSPKNELRHALQKVLWTNSAKVKKQAAALQDSQAKANTCTLYLAKQTLHLIHQQTIYEETMNSHIVHQQTYSLLSKLARVCSHQQPIQSHLMTHHPGADPEKFLT